MSDAKKNAEIAKEKDDRRKKLNKLRQRKRRESLLEQFGKIVPVHMKNETLKRLEAVFGTILRNRHQSGEAEKRSTTITELINQYYIDNLLPRQSDTSEETYKIYCLIWQMNFDKNHEITIANHLTQEGIKTPFLDVKSGRIMLDSGKWKTEDVRQLSDASKIIKMIESNERVSDKKTK